MLHFFTKEVKLFDDDEDDSWLDGEISEQVLLDKIANIKRYNFFDYIRKYIYENNSEEKADSYEKVPDKKYEEIAKKAFEENGLGDYWKNKAKKHLSMYPPGKYRCRTSREIAFYWIYGLNIMDINTVRMLLKKALRQTDFNSRSVYEVISYYVISKKLGYKECERLLNKYINMLRDGKFSTTDAKSELSTKVLAKEMVQILDEEELFQFLEKVTIDNAKRGLIIDSYEKEQIVTQTCSNKHIIKVYDSLLKGYMKNLQERGEKYEDCVVMDKKLSVKRNSVVNSIIQCEGEEGAIYEYVGKDYFVNWGDFISNQLTNNWIKNKLEGTILIQREDIITLTFLNHCYDMEKNLDEYYEKSKDDIIEDFKDIVNKKLAQCGMYDFYLPNPFEMFIAISLCSADPLDTFITSINLIELKKNK